MHRLLGAELGLIVKDAPSRDLAGPPADSSSSYYWRCMVQECLGPILSVSHHRPYEAGVAVKLRCRRIQIPEHLNPRHLDDLVLGAREDPLGNPLVDLLCE